MMSSQSDAPDIHIPEPSIWPFILTIGVVLIAAGVLTSVAISGIGLGILFIALVGWTQENRIQPAEEE